MQWYYSCASDGLTIINHLYTCRCCIASRRFGAAAATSLAFSPPSFAMLRPLARNAESVQISQFHCHASEVRVSHASMLKARRHHQKIRKLLDGANKRAKRLAKQAAAGPAVKKERSATEK